MSTIVQEQAWCASTPKRTPAAEPHAAGLKSVGSALDVLECFATDGELGVSDIARRLGVAKSTAHRLLQTLASRGFVEQDAQGQYRLGIHVYELGALALARNELRHVALPFLRQVAAATGLTVNLSVPDGADIVFVERIENSDGVRILGHFGRRLPAHTTSSGKAIAAWNTDLDAARRRAGFPPRVSRTVRAEPDWDRTLDGVRRVGYAVSHSESFDGASSVAVPVMLHRQAVASVSVFGPSEVIEPQVERLVPVLLAASRRIALAHGR
ncbi:IclR family transcriptional regulator [Phycicoccus avicenniae]|uniref:IclR family transcriptional regulator n=1 Tax=Phycicoccus avicenniae TaxID=2828860 RepID=UPI003D2BA75D